MEWDRVREKQSEREIEGERLGKQERDVQRDWGMRREM